MSEEHPSRQSSGEIPAEISHLVRERTEARRARDWARADELKRQIEEAGWKLVDHGGRTSVSPAAAADVEVGGRMRYGTWRTVPSRLGEPAGPGASVVTVASEQPERIRRILDGLAEHASGTHVVVVANDPSAAQETALREAETRFGGRLDLEVIGTSTRLGHAGALNVGLHRAGRDVVVIADGTAWPAGDALSALVATLGDPEIAAAGGFGLVASEPGPLRPAELSRAERGPRPVVALELAWLGFRRSDYARLGPLDEGFVAGGWLDVWWTLRLRTGPGDREAGSDADREAGSDADREAGSTPSEPTREAVQLDLPLERAATGWPPERIRLNRRNMYRVLGEFGARPELLGS